MFEISSDGTEKVVYAFQGGTDGFEPVGGLIGDSEGNLYGATALGGSGTSCGDCGTIFRIAPDGTKAVLYSFQGGTDGYAPASVSVIDSRGNLFGTTTSGGANGQGTVFEYSRRGSERVLYAFKGASDGSTPFAGVSLDKGGNLYGTTYYGGDTKCGGAGCGTVFKLTPDGVETVLFRFGRRGKNPSAGLLMTRRGLLYGTATAGGAHKDGVVFKLKE